jgi:fumarylacetoacetase
LDFELEMGFVVGKATSLGQMVSTAQAEDYIFGMVLFNDWSARDIQAWEYVPLGPFLAKNFNSTMSAWVVTLEALEAYRTSSPKQDTEVLPYLKTDGNTTFDIELEVEIIPEGGSANRVCRSNFKYLYWSMAQQLCGRCLCQWNHQWFFTRYLRKHARVIMERNQAAYLKRSIHAFFYCRWR